MRMKRQTDGAAERGAIQNSAREAGHISTPRLNTLLCFHLEPINLVIS